MELRLATHADATAVARLHANSWHFAYRGAFIDEYLELEADRDRMGFWEDRLGSPVPNQHVFVLIDDARLIGFACVYTDHHPEFGSFLNNLHVAEDRLREGHGARLMSAVRNCCLRSSAASPVYLLVLESNRRAQAFYSRHGGACRRTYPWTPPGGGSLLLQQFVWDSPEDIRQTSLPAGVGNGG